MKKNFLLALLVIPVLFSISFAVDTSINIENGDFEDTQAVFRQLCYGWDTIQCTVNGSYSTTEAQDWIYTGYASPIPPDPTTFSDSQKIALIDGSLLYGVNVDSQEGSYSYSNIYVPALWNYTGEEIGTADLYTAQSFLRNAEDRFSVSGYYKVHNPYGREINSSLAEFYMGFGSSQISFNLTNDDTWKYFEVEFDSGSVDVISGDVSASSNFADFVSVVIYTYFDLEESLNYYNITNSTDSFYFMLDDIQIQDLSSVLADVGDYYDLTQMALTGFYATTSVESGFGSYYSYFYPTVDNTKFYQGTYMDSMKTKYIELRFTDVSFSSNSNCVKTQINVEDYSYWNGTAWITDNAYDYFENTCGSMTTTVIYDQTWACWNVDVATDYTPTFNVGFIVPKDATQFRITFNAGRTAGGCGQFANGNVILYFNTTSTVIPSQNEIYTELADPDSPTYFPVLAQYVTQSGSGNKNMTIYHLNLNNDISRNLTMTSQDLVWIKGDLSEQLLTTYSTGLIETGSYALYTYDTSGWDLQTGDTVALVNDLTTFDYFGEVYVPTSYYEWDNPEVEICSTGCVGGNYRIGTFDPDTFLCSYYWISCYDDCVDTGMEIEISNLTTTGFFAEWEDYNSHYYELTEEDTETVVENGTTLLNSRWFEDLEDDTNYVLEITGYNKSECEIEVSNSTLVTTPEFSYASGGIWDIVTGVAEDVGEQINNGITTFVLAVGKSFGVGESGSRTIIWLFLTGLIIVGVVIFIAKKDVEADITFIALAVGGICLVTGLVLGWINVWFGVITILILVGVIYLKLTS